jgi:antitoxin PrlF
MASFSGKITTTGKSEAIRLEKALFRAHPEFRQKAAVRASVIAPSQLLVSMVEEDSSAGAGPAEDDPLVGAFLAFLADDIRRQPGRVAPLSTSRIEQAAELTEDVQVEDDEPMPDGIGL